MDRANGEIIDLNRIPAKVVQDSLKDPASSLLGMPPNLGRMVPPHIYTVQGRVGTIARVYRNADEAIRENVANARYMRNECGIMECLEARQRGTALLKWHLSPDDEKNAQQQDLAQKMTQLIEKVPQFVEMRRNLLEALWFGKYAVAYQWGNRIIHGSMRKTITHWEPRNGDKLVFRYEDGELKYDDRQVGIRVGAGYQLDISAQGVGFWSADARHKVEPTDQGLAYFFDKWERDNLIAIHKHIIEDGAWEDPLSAGAIHGIGIRSRIYATWFSMQELLGYLMEYVERAAGGVEIWPYEYGNSESEEKTRRAAEEYMVGGRSIILMPVYRGEDSDMFQVQHIEPGLGGVESLKSLIIEFFGHKIKRYILGQTLTSEAEATGLGSGVADAHVATYSDIIRYDARKLEETLTTDLVEPLKNQNYPTARDISVRFVIDTEADEMQEKLEAYERAWNMGLKIKAEDVASMIGASDPGEDDEVLENPQIQQAAQMGAMGGVGFAGPEKGGQTPPGKGEPPEGPEPEPARPLAPEPVPPEEKEPEPYEAKKERVIESTGGGEDPFAEVVERKKLGRYALGYQDQPNGVFACFNCRWRERPGGECSMYCHLNEKYAEKFDLEAGVDADAWCELHTEPGSGNLVRIERYAAAAKWDESKHPRDEEGKFGSGGAKAKEPKSEGEGQKKPSFEHPTATIKGAAGEFEMELKKDQGMWFTRKAGRPDLGWTAASAGVVKQIQKQQPTPPPEKGISEAVLRGDKFVLPDGSPLPEHVPRIPPAWKNVRVSLDANAPLLVTGVDAKGRRQSIYSSAHSMRAAAAKFAKISELAEKRQSIAQQIAQSRQENNETAHVTALIVATGLRPGSDRDTKAEKQAYGATTLLGKHVIQTNEGVRLKFTGKKGVEIDVPVNDESVAGMLLLRKASAGDDGRLFSISDTHLREYVSTLNGGGFRPKDFRTLKGTSAAARFVEKIPHPTNMKEYKKAVSVVGEKVAQILGNTKVIALQSYIDPTVFEQIRPQAG